METGLSSRPLQVSPREPAAARPAGPHSLWGVGGATGKPGLVESSQTDETCLGSGVSAK